MIQNRTSRRSFLGMLGICIPAQRALGSFSGTMIGKAIGERLVDLFDHRSSAAAIGDAYLATLGEMPGADELIDEFVNSDPVSGETLEDLTESELRQYVQARITEDFESNRTTRVNGWVFSKAEVLLYALASVRS